MDELSLAESRRDAQEELRQRYECKLLVYLYYTIVYYCVCIFAYLLSTYSYVHSTTFFCTIRDNIILHNTYTIHYTILYCIRYTGPYRVLQAAESAGPIHPSATRRRRCRYTILCTYIPFYHYIYMPYILYTYFCTPIHNILLHYTHTSHYIILYHTQYAAIYRDKSSTCYRCSS